MRLFFYDGEDISTLATPLPGMPLPAQGNIIPLHDSRRDLDFKDPLPTNPRFAAS